MDFELSGDHTNLRDALDRRLAPFRTVPLDCDDCYALDGGPVEAALAEGSFFDVGGTEELGILGAVLLIEAVAQVPYAVEIGASALVAPFLGLTLPRPLALVSSLQDAPIRFLPRARAALIEEGELVRMLDLSATKISAIDAPFAYPCGRISAAALRQASPVPQVSPRRLCQAWQIALAAEILGASQSAFDLTLNHVKSRQQFNRPIGAFQAIQHRLAEVAIMLQSLRLLTYQAALSSYSDHAAIAAGYAQTVASRVIYDTQQFTGAIGLTVEYPLHHWTYRLRVLQGEHGGATQHLATAWDGASPSTGTSPFPGNIP